MEDHEIPAWINGILAKAFEKRSSFVCIRLTDDESGLETLVHECGDEGCAHRPPVIPAGSLSALLTHLRLSTDGHNSPPSKFIWMGTFDSEVNGVNAQIHVRYSGTPRQQVDLRISSHYNTAPVRPAGTSPADDCEGHCCDC